MQKHKIVIPLKVEIIMELLKGKRLIFNDEVEIIPEVDGKQEKYDLLQKLKHGQYLGTAYIFEEIEKQMGITEEEIKIFNDTRIV